MQKLVFTNGGGQTIDLTSGNFGITNWEGLSGTGLNIQVQQVPFQDGGVFLDALMEQREISVTVAIQDNNDLSLRYELKRQLISALNPKLGEGVLVYTNDYLSRQIKAVPQLPIFENKNSNDAGTLKANVTFSCPSPYWEDLAITRIALADGIRKLVENNGDVPCPINIEIETEQAENPIMKNITQNKKIELNGEYNSNIEISTQNGNKYVIKRSMQGKAETIYESPLKIIKAQNQYIIITSGRYIYKSEDCENWNLSELGGNYIINDIVFSEEKNKYVIVGIDIILTSADSVSWTPIEVTGELNSITYSSEKQLFVACGNNGVILTSADGVSWTSRSSGTSESLLAVTCSDTLFVTVGSEGTILTSADGVSWTSRSSAITEMFRSACYSEKDAQFAICSSESILTSADGISWTQKYHTEYTILRGITYLENKSLYFCYGMDSTILRSSDGENWVKQIIDSTLTFTSILYSYEQGIYVLTCSNEIVYWTGSEEINVILQRLDSYIEKIKYFEKTGIIIAISQTIMFSKDSVKWENTQIESEDILYDVCYADRLKLYVVVGENGAIYTSSNLIQWTKMTSGTAYTLKGVEYSEEKGVFIAVGENQTVLRSIDGITWTRTTAEQSFSSDVYSVIYSNKYHCFVITQANAIYTSPDGADLSWNKIQITGTIVHLCYSEDLDLFVGAGFYGFLVTSEDLQVWTERESQTTETFYDLIYVKEKGMFVGLSYQKKTTSYDGINWQGTEESWSQSTICYYSPKDIYISYGDGGLLYSEYIETENLISQLQATSDMNISLEVGVNAILLNCLSGNIMGNISFRQKYLGV